MPTAIYPPPFPRPTASPPPPNPTSSALSAEQTPPPSLPKDTYIRVMQRATESQSLSFRTFSPSILQPSSCCRMLDLSPPFLSPFQPDIPPPRFLRFTGRSGEMNRSLEEPAGERGCKHHCHPRISSTWRAVRWGMRRPAILFRGGHRRTQLSSIHMRSNLKIFFLLFSPLGRFRLSYSSLPLRFAATLRAIYIRRRIIFMGNHSPRCTLTRCALVCSILLLPSCTQTPI